MGKFSLLSVFRTSLLAKSLNSSLVVLFILTQSFQMGFAHEIEGPNFTNQPGVTSSQIVESSEDIEFNATAISPLPSYADFMDPSPLSTVAVPRAMPGSLFHAHETSATVELESVTRSGAYYTDSKGTMIFADGRLTFDQPHLAEGIYDITIYAFGFPQSSVTPQFRMLADNKMISGPVEVTNQDWTYRPYTISNVELVGDGHDFRIELPGGFGEVNLYLDKVVFEKTGDLLPPAERVVIEAETMTVQGGFYQAPNSMLLWSNGSLTSQREVASGVYDVEIVAFGLDGDGALPQMRLLAGNHMVGDAVAVRKNDWNYQG